MKLTENSISSFAALFLVAALTNYRNFLLIRKEQNKQKELQAEKEGKIAVFIKKSTEANKLINEESNRLITWALSIIGGSILTIISTSYVHPKGPIIYTYLLFVVGWSCLSASIFFGEMITRIYIAGITINEQSDKSLERINKISFEVDKKFGNQIKWFSSGIIVFALWLLVFLIWLIAEKR